VRPDDRTDRGDKRIFRGILASGDRRLANRAAAN